MTEKGISPRVDASGEGQKQIGQTLSVTSPSAVCLKKFVQVRPAAVHRKSSQFAKHIMEIRKALSRMETVSEGCDAATFPSDFVKAMRIVHRSFPRDTVLEFRNGLLTLAPIARAEP